MKKIRLIGFYDFNFAKNSGLGITAHAGEICGAGL